jgi:hypothetical protein
MIPVSLSAVTSQNYLAFWSFGEPRIGDDQLRKVEVYTGWVVLNFDGGDDVIRRDQIGSFLPTSSGRVLQYEHDLISTTVTVAPAIIASPEDDVMFGVDDAFVDLRDQGLGSNPPRALVLTTALAAMNATIVRFTYQVTVLAERSERGRRLEGVVSSSVPQGI